MPITLKDLADMEFRLRRMERRLQEQDGQIRILTESLEGYKEMVEATNRVLLVLENERIEDEEQVEEAGKKQTGARR